MEKNNSTVLNGMIHKNQKRFNMGGMVNCGITDEQREAGRLCRCMFCEGCTTFRARMNDGKAKVTERIEKIRGKNNGNL
jgi:hypothetical protein